MRQRQLVTKVIRYSWESGEIGSVTFLSNSWVKLTYLGDVYILPLSLPLSDYEGHTSQHLDKWKYGTIHPDNWKYNTIGRWLVTGEELL